MASRSLWDLEIFLAEQSVAIEDRVVKVELNCYGWRLVRERMSRPGGVQVGIGRLVECDDNFPAPYASARARCHDSMHRYAGVE